MPSLPIQSVRVSDRKASTMTSSPLWLKIITGPGTGIDRAAADFARQAGLPVGRAAPVDASDPKERGRLGAGNSNGAASRLIAHLTADADGLLLISLASPGAEAAKRVAAAGRNSLPFYHVDLSSSSAFAAARAVAAWSSLHRIRVLAVTGSGDKDTPRSCAGVIDLLASAFTLSLAGFADGDGPLAFGGRHPRGSVDGIPETLQGAVHWLVDRLTLGERVMIARTGRLDSLSHKLKGHLTEDLRLPYGNAPLAASLKPLTGREQPTFKDFERAVIDHLVTTLRQTHRLRRIK
jgi:hypothetical protein